MRLSNGRFTTLAVVLVALNVSAWCWVRNEVLHRPFTGFQEPVKVSLATQNVDRAERLVFQFNQAVDAAKRTDEEVTAAPLRIEPALLGYWEWRTPYRLDYVLAAPIPPGRTFQVTPASGVFQESGQVVQADQKIEIKTEPLRWLECSVRSADRHSVNLALKFNQPVSPNDLLRHIEITDAGQAANGNEKPTKLDVQTNEKDPKAALTVSCSRPRGSGLHIKLAKELTGHGAELSLETEQVRVVEVSRHFALLRAHAQAEGYDYRGTIDLRFSRPLDRNQTLPKIEIDPPVSNLSVTVYDYGHSSVVLVGDFKSHEYRITVPETLLAEDGATLGSAQTAVVEMPDRHPTVHFAAQRGFLSPHGHLLLDLETVNVEGLRFELAQVHRNNLIAHLDGDPATRTTRPLAKLEVPVTAPRNEITSSAVDLKKLIGDRVGIFHLRARDTQDGWIDDDVVFTVTDLAMTAKRERGGVLVWVTSLMATHPQPGVKVSVLTYTNQTLGTGITGPDGSVRIAIDDKHPDGAPWVLVAEREHDASFLQLDRSGWNLDDIDQTGKDIPSHYDVQLFTERGVYRPGETIHLAGIIRDEQGQVPASFPLKITVRRPDRRIARELTVTPTVEANGTFAVDVPTHVASMTGPYRVQVTLPGSDEVLGSTMTLVEAFEPARIEVVAQAEPALVEPGQNGAVQVDGKYLFGPPASGLPVVVAGRWQRAPFESKQSRGFTFGERSEFNQREIVAQQSMLDDAGHARVEVVTPADLPKGWWRAALVATVTEIGGRSTSHAANFVLDNAGRHVGLKPPFEGLAPIEKPIEVEWVVRNSRDELAEPGLVQIELSRVEYDWHLQRQGHMTFWRTTERLIPVSTQTVGEGQAAGKFSVTCSSWGRFRLVATDKQSGNRTRLEWYASSDDAGSALASLNRPERVELVLDQPQYAPGSTAKLLVRSPFNGTALVCLEAEKVRHQQVVTLAGPSTTVEIPVPADLRGGGFISASVVRPIDLQANTWLPHRAMGLTRLVVDHGSQRLPVTVSAPSQVRPEEAVTVDVQVESANRPAMVQLWAVDDGILLTTAYKTPKPHQHFFAPRRSEIGTSDIFGDLLPDHLRPASIKRIGADGDEDGEVDAAELRGEPTPSKRRESFVVWKGWTRTDDAGRATLNVTLPSITGRVRWMAVAVQDDRYGHSDLATTITAPLLVETSWPRFAAPGDVVKVPVKLFNTTTQELAVKVGFEVLGPLELAPWDAKQVIQIPAGKSEVRWIEAKAIALGEAVVKVIAQAPSTEHGDLISRQETKLPVRVVTSRGSDSQIVVARAGQPLRFELPPGFRADHSDRRVLVSAQTRLQLRPAIEALIDYPYGCVEQTSSRMLALLAAADVLGLQAEDAGRQALAGELVDAGIVRLWTMQTPSGGLSYWPNTNQASVWATAYAGGVLAECQQRGKSIDPRFVSELVKYLQSAFKRNLADEFGTETENIEALLCRVLAAFQQPQIGWMSRLSESIDRLDTLGRADLARAWMLAGRRDRALACLPEDTLERLGAMSHSSRITSPLQQQAALLTALLEIAPEHQWVPLLARQVEQGRTNGQWRSTLENAAAISALARYSQHVAIEPPKFRGSLLSGPETAIEFDATAPKTLYVKNSSDAIEVLTEGTGEFIVTLTTTGLRTKEAQQREDHGIEVRREWLNSNGKPVDPTALKVGDLITVRVKFRSFEHEAIENIAIVDALPAGLEVENPRLATSAVGTDTAPQADRVEFLDDRVLVFGTAHRHEQVFEYSLRVTTAGTFELPAIHAVAMYDSSLTSSDGAGQVTVR